MVNVNVVESIDLDTCSSLAWQQPSSWLCIPRAVLNANWSGCYTELWSIPIVKVFVWEYSNDSKENETFTEWAMEAGTAVGLLTKWAQYRRKKDAGLRFMERGFEGRVSIAMNLIKFLPGSVTLQVRSR